MAQAEVITLPKIIDHRGNLTFIEQFDKIPFEIKRAYWIYDVPGGKLRCGHANRTSKEFIVALSGSFDVVIHNGKEENKYSLNRSYYGVYLPEMLWRSLENFSTNALCLVLASDGYQDDDYIRNFEEYKVLTK